MRVALVTSLLLTTLYFLTFGEPIEVQLQSYYTPLKTKKVSSGFGKRGNAYHNGVDYSTSYGEAVYSPCQCNVVDVSYNSRLGKYVVLRDQYGLSFTFAHLSVQSVTVSDYVVPHQLLGKVGNSGYSFGPHLHFEVQYQNVTFNPESLRLLSW